MIICFNCRRDTKLQMDSMVAEGQYKDHSELIECAVSNLALLHQSMSGSTSIVIESASGAAADRQTQDGVEPALGGEQVRWPGSNRSVTVPDVFQLPDAPKEEIATAPFPDDIWAKGQDVPLERWLFGQFNKFLPAKANTRALANLLLSSPKGVPLDEAGKTLSADGLALGDYLKVMDDRLGLKRGEKFSTAFPVSPDKESKGRLRYVSQFLASKNKAGQLSGMLVALKLVNRAGQKTSRLVLTQAGLDFAYLENPVLDDTAKEPSERLSVGEKDFLLDHIKTNVPAEDCAYRTIIGFIIAGGDNPKRLDAELRLHISPERRDTVLDSFIATQRSGALSRMVDLGLIKREKQGITVKYIVTDAGQEYRAND